MMYRFTDNEDLGLLKIIKEFIEKELLLMRTEIMKQENGPDQILQ